MERQARRAILEHALFRVENAIIIAGVILLGFFLPSPLPNLLPWWGWWTWALIGLIGIALIVVSTLTDQAEAEKAVEKLFLEQYDISGIRDRALQKKLKRAEQYHEEIKEVVKKQQDGLLKDRLKRTTDQIYDWIGHMVRLARRIDAYRGDPIISSDSQELQESLPRLENRLKLETDARVRSQLETTLADKRRLQQNIVELNSRMRRADLQLDSSLASLGTIYSQLLLVGSKEVDSGRTERLRSDIADEVHALQDVVESINEIYDYHTLGPGK
jgi:SMC interacting uncharacterized protein involved in chromosome segregation